MYCDVQMIVALSAVIVKLSETKPFLVLVECDSQISIFSVTLKLQLGLEAYCCKVRHGSPMFSLGQQLLGDVTIQNLSLVTRDAVNGDKDEHNPRRHFKSSKYPLSTSSDAYIVYIYLIYQLIYLLYRNSLLIDTHIILSLNSMFS